MNIVFLVLSICAGLAFLGGIFQGIMAGIELTNHAVKSGQKKKWFAIILACVVLAGFSGYGAYASYKPSNYISTTSSPTPSTATTPTSLPSPTATSTSSMTLAADSTITENKLLTCSTCSGGNDPIHFTVDSVTIDNANGRTVWNATLNNISGGTYDVVNPGITLQIASGITAAVRSTGYLSTYMNPGAKAAIQFTFAFVPYKGVPYTFLAHLNTSDALTDMPFDPVNFTFPTSASTSSVTPAVTPLATDNTITENKLLTCSTCSGGNDPIHFTVDSVTIDNANGRTVWNATLNNISGDTYDVVNPGITLQIASGITAAVRSTGYLSTYMNPGAKAAIQFTFAFVPYKGVPYTFLAHLNTSDALTDMPFDPVKITF